MHGPTIMFTAAGSILLVLSFFSLSQAKDQTDVWLCTTAIIISVAILLISIGVSTKII